MHTSLEQAEAMLLLPQRKITAGEYHRMFDAGILGEDDHVQLIEGVLVQMTPQNIHHSRVITRMTEAFVGALAGRFATRVQIPLTLGRHSEPEPDFAIVTLEEAEHRKRQPASALLVVEVADSTLRFDREVKLPLYARAGIPEYWIVNTRDRVIEVYRSPIRAAARYRSSTIARTGEKLKPANLPGPTLDVAMILRT
jgi:Uma2 family endonuclease